MLGQSNATEDQKIRDGFASIQTLLNGNVDEANAPNMAAAFTTYKRLARGNQTHAGAAVPGTILCALNAAAGFNVNNIVPGSASAIPGDFVIYLDPAIYNANARVTKLNVRLGVVPNGTAPAITYTAGLYPIATYGGAAAGGTPFIATIGTVITGSTAAVVNPAANALSTATSGDFNFPAAGAYVLGVVPSAATSANNVTGLIAQLEMRQV